MMIVAVAGIVSVAGAFLDALWLAPFGASWYFISAVCIVLLFPPRAFWAILAGAIVSEMFSGAFPSVFAAASFFGIILAFRLLVLLDASLMISRAAAALAYLVAGVGLPLLFSLPQASLILVSTKAVFLFSASVAALFLIVIVYSIFSYGKRYIQKI